MPHLGFIFHSIYLIFNILCPNQLNPFNVGLLFNLHKKKIKLVSKLWGITRHVSLGEQDIMFLHLNYYMCHCS